MAEFTRREVLRIAAAGLAGAAAPFGGGARASAAGGLAGTRPNIILILTDDQGYGDVGRHGHPFLKTPHLDALHDESLRFTDFHVSPYCVPTRAALLTGRNPARCGVTGCRWRLTPGIPTLAEALRAAGYATGIFGKWHLGDDAPCRPDRRGFDETLIHGGGYLGSPWGDFPNNSYFDPVLYHNGKVEETRGYCADVFFERAFEWAESVRDRKPFFVYLAPNTPHEPFVAPEACIAPYRDAVRSYAKDPSFLGQRLEPEEQAAYFGMIANLDANVGRLMERLRAADLDRETLVVYMNDNGTVAGGGYWNAGMRGGKATVFSGGTRAISYWRMPGSIAPGACDAFAAHLDVLPTLAALAGAALPAEVQGELDGRSLLPLIENPGAPWPERMLFEHLGTWRQGKSGRHVHSACSVRRGKLRMLRNERVCDADCPLCGTILHFVNAGDPGIRAAEWELYDLASDPGERRDLASEQPEIVAELASAYEAWWRAMQPYHGDTESGFGHSDPLPFAAMYWRKYRGPGPNEAPPPEGFLEGISGAGERGGGGGE